MGQRLRHEQVREQQPRKPRLPGIRRREPDGRFLRSRQRRHMDPRLQLHAAFLRNPPDGQGRKRLCRRRNRALFRRGETGGRRVLRTVRGVQGHRLSLRGRQRACGRKARARERLRNPRTGTEAQRVPGSTEGAPHQSRDQGRASQPQRQDLRRHEYPLLFFVNKGNARCCTRAFPR